MEMINEIRAGRHCVFDLHVHLVFVAKYRRDIFTKAILERMEDVLRTVCSDFESDLVEFDGEKDHVHVLINYPPKVQISKLVNSLKGVSSRLLRKEFPELTRHYYKDVLWSPSYFAASCGGASISIVKKYIQSQSTPP
jgi:putative transposase